jgi:transposase-like protein
MLSKFLRRQGAEALRITTDKLKSYSAGHGSIFGNETHSIDRFVNNRAKASHQPTRQPKGKCPDSHPPKERSFRVWYLHELAADKVRETKGAA